MELNTLIYSNTYCNYKQFRGIPKKYNRDSFIKFRSLFVYGNLTVTDDYSYYEMKTVGDLLEKRIKKKATITYFESFDYDLGNWVTEEVYLDTVGQLIDRNIYSGDLFFTPVQPNILFSLDWSFTKLRWIPNIMYGSFGDKINSIEDIVTKPIKVVDWLGNVPWYDITLGPRFINRCVEGIFLGYYKKDNKDYDVYFESNKGKKGRVYLVPTRLKIHENNINMSLEESFDIIPWIKSNLINRKLLCP